jgi:cysteinyl-tRNA synthetase
VPATDCIRDFIDMISVLIDKGYAYYAGGNVYFDTSKLDRYYVLTGQEEEARAVGVRDSVEEDANKRNKSDFVLWFTKSKFENQELKWDSPWGLGYPGWHIECSSIAIKHLGPHLDIHCGGIDNAFPHHNNEIAQSEAFLGHKWCNIWFHVLHLNHNEGKMSKSEGGFLTVSMLEEQNYDPMVYRLYCLLSHYRKPLSFGFDVLDNTASVYRKLIDRIRGLKDGGAVEHQKAEAFRQSFIEALCGDINTASAVKVLYDVFKADISDKTKLYLVCDFDKVLSLNLIKAAHSVLNIDDRLQTYIESKIRERLQARMNKDYDLADSIRDELTKQGITIKDTREGTSWDLINKTG